MRKIKLIVEFETPMESDYNTQMDLMINVLSVCRQHELCANPRGKFESEYDEQDIREFRNGALRV